MRLIYVLAAIAIDAAMLVNSVSAGDAPITVTVRLDKRAYMPGEPILLELEFQNHTDKLCMSESPFFAGETFDQHGYLEDALKAVLRGPDGFVQTWRQRFRRSPNELGWGVPFVLFRPHKRTQCSIILSRMFQPTVPGEYRLEWKLIVPIEEDPRHEMPGPRERHRLNANGTLNVRIVAANGDALEKRADALLAEAQQEKFGEAPSLFVLATMPPDIAMPRFRRFLNLKYRKKPHGQLEVAVHALVYVDTKEAVDLIAEVTNWTYHFNSVNHNAPPQTHQDVGFGTYFESIRCLENMYYMTSKPALRRYIKSSVRQLAPHLVKPDEPEEKPNIPST